MDAVPYGGEVHHGGRTMRQLAILCWQSGSKRGQEVEWACKIPKPTLSCLLPPERPPYGLCPAVNQVLEPMSLWGLFYNQTTSETVVLEFSFCSLCVSAYQEPMKSLEPLAHFQVVIGSFFQSMYLVLPMDEPNQPVFLGKSVSPLSQVTRACMFLLYKICQLVCMYIFPVSLTCIFYYLMLCAIHGTY